MSDEARANYIDLIHRIQNDLYTEENTDIILKYQLNFKTEHVIQLFNFTNVITK